jgi:Protein kinase domain
VQCVPDFAGNPAKIGPPKSKSEKARFNAAGDSGEIETLLQDRDIALRRIRREPSVRDQGHMSTMLTASERVVPDRLTGLAFEFSLAELLDRDWALRPLELLEEHARTTLIFEDPGGEILAQLLGIPMEIEKFLQLAVGISVATGKMHQRGLIHKDIKPANILVNSEDGDIRLTGFGMASRVVREKQSPDPPQSIAGTLAYMAPEQTGRMNRSIDSRSDLYALGVTFLSDADGRTSIQCHRRDGMDPLPHREARRSAR